jgi:hypothetical protein
MLDEVSRGRPPREAAALIHRRQRDRRRPSYCLVRSLLQGGDDDRRVRQVLDAAAHRLGPVQAMATVVAWTLRELRCPAGPTPPGLGESLRGWLRNVRGQGDHGTVLVAWMREGQPDLALEAIGALSRAMGWSTEELGPQTPLVAPDHSLSVTHRSSAVVLDAGASSDRGRALQTLRSAARIHPGPLFYMGTTFAAPGSRRHAPGRYLDDDFAIAAETYLRSMPTLNEDER